MKNKLKKFIMHPWTIGIICSVILPSIISSIILAFKNDINFFEAFILFFKKVIKFTSFFLDIKISILIFLIILLFIFILIIIVINTKKRILTRQQQEILYYASIMNGKITPDYIIELFHKTTPLEINSIKADINKLCDLNFLMKNFNMSNSSDRYYLTSKGIKYIDKHKNIFTKVEKRMKCKYEENIRNRIK